MKAYSIYEAIKEAFETSTLRVNRFERVIRSIRWDNQFEADGEYYFNLGAMTFTTPSLNPFEITKDWRPSFIFEDGSMIYI